MSASLHRRRFLAGTAFAAGATALGVGTPTTVTAAPSRAWGDLVGRFVYGGPAPARAKLTVDKDVAFCGKFDIRDESLVVGRDGGLAHVFVYLRSRPVAVCPDLERGLSARVTLDNRECMFRPHCLTIWYPKQELYILNSGLIAESVAFSPPRDEPANVVLAAGEHAVHRFGRAQAFPVPIACNFHPWESAYILPQDHPYMAISRPDGRFRIPRLPVGRVEFQAWHERVGYLATAAWPKGRFTVEIKPGTTDLGNTRLVPAPFGGAPGWTASVLM